MQKDLMPARPAIFLDRDGTLNEDKGYVHKIEDWVWLPKVKESLISFKRAGYALIVVTNQSGIARGYYAESAMHALHELVNAELKKQNCSIDAFYFCPHLPEITGSCQCRKPLPQMLLHAAREHNIDLARSWMIGDRMRDVDAGIAAGCKTLLLSNEPCLKEKTASVTTLAEAVKIICKEDI